MEKTKVTYVLTYPVLYAYKNFEQNTKPDTLTDAVCTYADRVSMLQNMTTLI